MTNNRELVALAERVEQATCPDRELTFSSYEEWSQRRDRLVALANRTTPGFGARYFALIDAAYEGMGEACAMIFRDALRSKATTPTSEGI